MEVFKCREDRDGKVFTWHRVIGQDVTKINIQHVDSHFCLKSSGSDTFNGTRVQIKVLQSLIVVEI